MIANSIFCLACILTTLFLRWCLQRENAKLQALEIQNSVQEESEKVAVEEIVDANARGGLLVLNPGFRYIL